MKHYLILTILSSAINSAFATSTPPPTVPSTSVNTAENFYVNPVANAAAGAIAISESVSTSGASNQNTINTGTGSNRSYAFLGAGTATPLPAGVCPKGDSHYFQLLFGLITVASSSTRTEMECLDKLLTLARETAVPTQMKPQIIYLPGEPINPICTPEITSTSESVKKSNVIANKKLKCS